MGIVTINISLPDTMKADVEEIVESEGYGNTSEFFRDLVRNHIRKAQSEKLEAMLLDSLNEEMTPLTRKDFEDMKKRSLKRLKKLQKSK